MDTNHITVLQSDGYQTKLYPHLTDKEVLGSILILHGMAEYHVRYEGFAAALNEAGYDVYLYNHRGHGTDCTTEELGFFAEKDGAARVIEDAVTLCRYVKDHGRSDKFAAFGHSMGSLILRNVIQTYDAMDCAVICGSTMPPAAVANAGALLANLLCRTKGPRSRSPFLHNMMFGNNYYKETCTRTSSDWLTRDETIVDWYNDSPYCGFLCTTSMYRDMMVFLQDSGNPKKVAKTRHDLPLYFIVGEKDPVSNYSVQVEQLFRLYEKLGFSDIALSVYPEARHEILNELNKEDVIDDLIAFFHAKLHPSA